MKLVNNKVDEYIQKPGIDGIYDAIRDAAAICYQTDVEKMKLKPMEFVENVLIKNAHMRPLEFGSVYLKIPRENESRRYLRNEFTKWVFDSDNYYVTTNFRVIMQGYYDTDEEAHSFGYNRNWLDDLKYWCEPTKKHPPRRTFTMSMSRGCTDDNRTHTSLSGMCESSRYCNYSKDKFNNELTWIKPYWISEDAVKLFESHTLISDNNPLRDEVAFLEYMQSQEDAYMNASKMGMQAQQLKRLFPLGVKAELRLCGFDDAWENFFWRRCDGHADPECQIVANMIKDKF